MLSSKQMITPNERTMLSFREMITRKIKGNVITQPVDNTDVLIQPGYKTKYEEQSVSSS
jgi:hypothetical protein